MRKYQWMCSISDVIITGSSSDQRPVGPVIHEMRRIRERERERESNACEIVEGGVLMER